MKNVIPGDDAHPSLWQTVDFGAFPQGERSDTLT
jgi:hypothetical protein